MFSAMIGHKVLRQERATKMDTIYKAEKIRAGEYRYRGVRVHLREKGGFVYTVFGRDWGWFNGGLGTLKKALQQIDGFLSEPQWVVQNGDIWHKSRLTTGKGN